MAAGALMLYTAATEQWDYLPAEVQKAISNVLVITGIVLIALGAIIAFASPISTAIGIGMMVAGAAMLWTAVALNWDSMSEQMQQAVTAVMLVVGAAFLVIGAVLLFSGANVPLGLGLVAIGALALASVAILNWDAVKDDVGNVVESIKDFLKDHWEALLVLGVILCVTGIALPLGIALLAAGAVGLAAAADEDPDAVQAEIQGVVDSIVAFCREHWEALLVIGLVLLFVPPALPLALGALALGVAGLVADAEMDPDAAKEKVRGFGESVYNWIREHEWFLLVLGILLLFAPPFMPLGIACIFAGVASMVLPEDMDFDQLLEKIRETWDGIVAWWNANVDGIFTIEWWEDKFKCIANGLIGMINEGLSAFGEFVNSLAVGLSDILTFFHVDGFSFQIGMPQIPYLAQGAVIPPNRRFMAVLGDQSSGRNLEAPESLIRQIVREESGVGGSDVLYQILAAIQQGQNIYMDGDKVGSTVSAYQASMQRMSG